jgi:hypothetical protein
MANCFGEDAAFLGRHTGVVTLSDASERGQVLVAPGYQGRVMTSTTAGADGPSFGWINRELIASGTFLPQFNPFGGEDRFWLGPEGGPFALYFRKGEPFEFDYWQVPPLLDTEPFGVTDQRRDSVAFAKDALLVNYAGTAFSIRIERRVNVLDAARAGAAFGLDALPERGWVAYETVNTLTNTGDAAWTKETGLLSIWILGMYTPSPATTIVIPIREGTEAALGPKVNDAYFGAVPPERLRVDERHVFFRGDGMQRGKIGISPRRAMPVCGSYDAAGEALTLVQFNRPEGATEYVNSMWARQDDPFAGDVVNSYNDGPPKPGAKPLGPFYELETSSPAAALAPGESITHVHRTFHAQGEAAALDGMARGALDVGIEAIRGALG